MLSELDGPFSDATLTRFGPSGEVTVAHHGVQLCPMSNKASRYSSLGDDWRRAYARRNTAGELRRFRHNR